MRTSDLGVSVAADAMLSRFRKRHQSVDPLNDWQRSEPASEPATAFLAVALDPEKLDGLDTATARKLTGSAEAYSRQLQSVVPGPELSPVGAAVSSVLRTVAEWQAKNKPFKPTVDFGGGNDPEPPILASTIFRDRWSKVRSGFPQFDHASAAMCMQAVIDQGASGLDRSDEPELLLIGACRFAAWSVSGRKMTIKPATRAQCVQILVLAQLRCFRLRAPVLDVSYTGPLGEPWQQALSLAVDASACAHLMERDDLAASGLVADTLDGIELWGQSAGRHAYAAVALHSNAVTGLDIEMAREIARWTIQFALAVDAAETWAVMPRLAPGSGEVLPRVVVASMRRLADG